MGEQEITSSASNAAGRAWMNNVFTDVGGQDGKSGLEDVV